MVAGINVSDIGCEDAAEDETFRRAINKMTLEWSAVSDGSMNDRTVCGDGSYALRGQVRLAEFTNRY